MTNNKDILFSQWYDSLEGTKSQGFAYKAWCAGWEAALKPPKREWVGLTDEEIHEIIDACTPDEAEQDEINDFARAVRFVEAKLKEKNGG